MYAHGIRHPGFCALPEPVHVWVSPLTVRQQPVDAALYLLASLPRVLALIPHQHTYGVRGSCSRVDVFQCLAGVRGHLCAFRYFAPGVLAVGHVETGLVPVCIRPAVLRACLRYPALASTRPFGFGFGFGLVCCFFPQAVGSGSELQKRAGKGGLPDGTGLSRALAL